MATRSKTASGMIYFCKVVRQLATDQAVLFALWIASELPHLLGHVAGPTASLLCLSIACLLYGTCTMEGGIWHVAIAELSDLSRAAQVHELRICIWKLFPSPLG